MSFGKLSLCGAVACGFALAAFAQTASAAYVWGPDGFDTPSPYTEDASVIGQNGWTNVPGFSGTDAVIKDTGDASHGTAIYLNGNVVGRFYKNIPAPYNTDTTQIMRVQYDMYGTMASSAFTMPVAFIGDEQGSAWRAVMIEAKDSGSYGVSGYFSLNSGAYTVPDIESKGNVWYTVTVDLSFANKTFDITITDGTDTGSLADVPFWYDSAGYPVPGLNDIAFGSANYAGVFDDEYQSGYIDNVSIQMIPVPEPACFSLLVLGLGTLVMRRRPAA